MGGQGLGATQVVRAPDLSHRPEADGRWPRVVTGENGTLGLQRLTVLTRSALHLARTPVSQAQLLGLWLRRYVRAPDTRLQRACQGPDVSGQPLAATPKDLKCTTKVCGHMHSATRTDRSEPKDWKSGGAPMYRCTAKIPGGLKKDLHKTGILEGFKLQ